MQRDPHLKRLPIRLALLALAIAALIAPAGAQAAQGTKVVAKKLDNASLGKTILATRGGRTLYSLSAEKRGRWICTGACTSTWKPLTVRDGVKPKGPVKLGTIERPEGRTQVTYKGLPLYSFQGDTKVGDANGEGIRDVGTWHAAAIADLAAPPPAPEALPAQPPSPYPDPYPAPTPGPSPSPEPDPYPYPY